MRIVMIAGSVSRQAGGLFWSVRRLSQALQRAGAEVHVLGLRDEYSDEDIVDWAPLAPQVFDTLGPQKLGFQIGMRAAIEALKPDVVHLHGIWQGLSMVVSGLARDGYPTIISPRGMLDPWALANSRLKKRLAWVAWEKENLRRASCVHALNASEADAIRQVLPSAPIATIPNGIDIPKGLTRRKPIADHNEPRLLFMGRIHPKKGLMAFLDQWAEVRPRLSKPWRLRIAGPDEVGHLADLQARVRELSLEESVHFIGPVYGEQKERELEKAAAFVLPSLSEGLPMAVLEAWAHGLPTFITRECNLPEAFAEGAAIELTDDAQRLYRDLEEADLDSIGARACALAEDGFRWASIASRHQDVYSWMKRQDNGVDQPVDWSTPEQYAKQSKVLE